MNFLYSLSIFFVKNNFNCIIGKWKKNLQVWGADDVNIWTDKKHIKTQKKNQKRKKNSKILDENYWKNLSDRTATKQNKKKHQINNFNKQTEIFCCVAWNSSLTFFLVCNVLNENNFCFVSSERHNVENSFWFPQCYHSNRQQCILDISIVFLHWWAKPKINTGQLKHWNDHFFSFLITKINFKIAILRYPEFAD